MKKRMIALLGVFTLTFTVFTGCGGAKGQIGKEDVKPAEEAIEIQSSEDENKEATEEENTVGMANPWVEITEEEANGLCDRLFKAPEGAKVREWQKCESLGDPEKGTGPLIQLDFEFDGLEFTARAQQGATEDADISGIYAEWAVGPEDTVLANWGGGNMKGVAYRSTDDMGYTDLITWYDAEAGIKYSLSVTAPDLDGFDIQAVAEQMYYEDSQTSGSMTETGGQEEDADGFYASYLIASDKDRIGTTDENGMLCKVVYDSKLVDDTLYLAGSMDYRNDRDQDPITVSDDIMHVFKVNADTVYQMAGGDTGPENVSQEEFAGYLKDCADSGLYIEVEVSGGLVKTATISA